MRKIIMGLAVSLDSYIEGPNGEYDWCMTDQDYGLSAFFEHVDACFYGRKSYDQVVASGGAPPGFPKFKEYVFSTTMTKAPPGTILVGRNVESEVRRIKDEPGKDIWLFGGASLIASLMELGVVDQLWLSVHPILLGAGKPLFQNIRGRVPLELIDSKVYSTGLVSLTYEIKK
jgi:dihydrofolate reductase